MARRASAHTHSSSHVHSSAHSSSPASAPKAQLPGLNIYRALAVVLMILAHAARVQHPLTPSSPFDWPFLFSLRIEPIISALFLFIAGFSLVLSLEGSAETRQQWIKRLGGRMLTLYGISVLFFLADRGVQWPDLLVSSGVLGVIAVGVFSSALALVSPRPAPLLATLTITGLGITALVDSERWSITGLNAGAGGMLPLLTLAWLGTLTGLAYRRWPDQGLPALFGLSLVMGVVALVAPYPWITHPLTEIHVYPGDRIQQVLFSLQDLVGLYDGTYQRETVRFWNHGWIFPLRALPLLVLGLILFLGLVKQARNPALRFLDWMGRQALNLYILHLVLLAAVEIGPWQPTTGWQTLLLVAGIVAASPWILRYLSFVPFGIGGKVGRIGQTGGRASNRV